MEGEEAPYALPLTNLSLRPWEEKDYNKSNVVTIGNILFPLD
ncbi:hypothetical protein J5U22_01849 [Saccharolobus shibatae]|uniref:Uncharacterized protein n=1 Tax=Saccharolobus shibatae TaxID=2286 RepID=A0A8F5C1B6_9CREN|nr:hypothetical protein J5U22_01849 [Saccharolobus shibatae]